MTATANTTTRTPAVSARSDATQGLLNLVFSNGKTLNLHVSELSGEIRDEAIMHGLKQKLIDAAAISRDPDTGRSATADDKYQAVLEVFDRITRADGTWNAVRGTGEGNQGGALLRALIRLQPHVSPDTIREKMAGWDAKQKAAVRANPKVAAIIAEINAEKTGEVDTDELLAGLGD